MPPASPDHVGQAAVQVTPHSVAYLGLGFQMQVQHWTVKPVQQLGQHPLLEY